MALNLCLIVVTSFHSSKFDATPQQAIPPPGAAAAQFRPPNPAQPCPGAQAYSPAAPLHTQAASGVDRKRVVQKDADFKLEAGNQLVDPKDRFYFYRVEQINGPSVELKADEGGPSGWATADQVVLIEQVR